MYEGHCAILILYLLATKLDVRQNMMATGHARIRYGFTRRGIFQEMPRRSSQCSSLLCVQRLDTTGPGFTKVFDTFLQLPAFLPFYPCAEPLWAPCTTNTRGSLVSP